MSWHILIPDLPGDEKEIGDIRDRLQVWLLSEGLEPSTVTIDSALFRLQTTPPTRFQTGSVPDSSLPRMRGRGPGSRS